MPDSTKFTVGEWLAEPQFDRLSRDSQRVHLQPQVMSVLVYLARKQRDVVSTDELLATIWQGRVVTSASIYSALKQLRDALGDDAQNPRYIQTIPKRGYRLIAPVRFTGADSEAAEARPTADRSFEGLTRPPWKTAVTITTMLLAAAALFWLSLQPDPPVSTLGPFEAPPSLAVLPFEDPDQVHAQHWLGDGIATELAAHLAEVPGLKVIGRSSSFALRDDRAAPSSVARALGVSHLLRGQVRSQGDRLQISAQLVNTADGQQAWTAEYDHDTEALQVIRDAIADGVVATLGLRPTEPTATAAVHISSQAYSLYLQSLELIAKNTKNSLAGAVDRLSRAIEQAPRFANAHVALGRAYQMLQDFEGFYAPGTAYEESNRLAGLHVQRALQIDPDNASAWVVWSDVLPPHGSERREALERAIELNPNLYAAHTALGVVKNSYLLPWSDILVHLDRALEIEPLSIEAARMLVLFLAWAPHRWQDAETIIAEFRQHYPESNDVLMMRANWLLDPKGRPAEAIPILEQILVEDPDHFWARSFLTKAWFMVGEFDRASLMPGGVIHWRHVLATERHEALRTLDELPEWSSELDYGRRLLSAYTRVMLRDWQGAVDDLEADTVDPDRFAQIFVEDLARGMSPALSLAVAYQRLGDDDKYRKYSGLERHVLDVRSDGGRLHNFEYSRTRARLDALEGNTYEALLELKRLISEGPIDPRDLIHPAFDALRDDPMFREIEELQRARIDAERVQLGLLPMTQAAAPPLAQENH